MTTTEATQGLGTGTLTTRDIFVAGVGLVVAATTLVSDFNGWIGVGATFAITLAIAFVINLLLGLSVAELSTTYPRAGALYDYGGAALKGSRGALLGLFLAYAFYGMFALAGAGEITAGAFGAQAIFSVDGPVQPWIAAMIVAAVIPNIFGVKAFAMVELVVVAGMLALRWFFGIAGFLGFSGTGPWSAGSFAGSTPVTDVSLLLGLGLALAFWSFVGIEFVAPLAEETRNPARAMPRGIVLGLIVVFATSVVMGLGAIGTLPLAEWTSLMAASPVGANAPQLVVGEAMFGSTGLVLMALATFLATFASVNMAFAAMPRILYGIAREERLLGPFVSRAFAYTHPRYRTPVVAIGVTAALHLTVALLASSVLDLIFAAAYVWASLYVAYHVLVLLSRRNDPDVARPYRTSTAVPLAGIVLTVVGIYYAFAGAHALFGGLAALIFAGALVVALLSLALAPKVSPDTGADDRTDDQLAVAATTGVERR